MTWFDQHGRKHLPWQQDRDTYRVWVSEIMLQQTQVATVIPYYEKFMQRFPDLQALAEAPEDEVLSHWSGLGYYARARNLHRCAKLAMQQHGGHLPEDLDSLVSLPGIGRSTAGAVLSLALGQHHAILDGNVKRVLARHQAIDGWPGKSAVLDDLWALSEHLTPAERTADYNQAMMDLGATLCTRSRPDCAQCPVAADCRGLATGDPQAFPGRKPKKSIPTRHTCMLLLDRCEDEAALGVGGTLLQRRPASGIWGGLWSLPEVDSVDVIDDWLTGAGLTAAAVPNEALRLRHSFSHFHLEIEVLELPVRIANGTLMEQEERVWYKGGPLPGGVAAPVSRILNNRVGELL